MTMINVDTSPLQAAREWRGINLVSAAMASGLHVAQAEALEEGDADAFDSIDEMIASAVVYGASLGIGRDEAVALLDRTVSQSGDVSVEVPDAPAVRPGAEFSSAVRERSARIVPPTEAVLVEPLAPAPAMFVSDADVADPDLGLATPAPTAASTSVPAAGADTIEDVVEDDAAPIAPSLMEAAFPEVPQQRIAVPAPLVEDAPVFTGPSPEQAIAASSEMHVGFEAAPWDRSGGDYTGELEAWAAEGSDDDLVPGARVRTRPSRLAAVGERVGAMGYAGVERVLGTERADTVADAMSRCFGRIGEIARSGREQMRRSEHATLIVAIGGGAVLIALVVAIGGALGGDDPVNPATVRTSPKIEAPGVAATGSTAATTTKKAAAAAKVTPMLAPAKVQVDVFNAGSKKGYAKQVGDQLKAAKYQVGKVENAGGKYDAATVIYPASLEREARVLARRVGVTTLQEAPAGAGQTGITLVVT